jgi:HSP20 family protein
MTRGQNLPSRQGGISERNFGSPLFSPILALYRDMNRLFDDASGGGLALSPSGVRHSAGALMPQIDVSETDQEIRVTAEMPGVNENDVEVTVSDDMLVIRGQKQIEHEEDRQNYHVNERVFGTFMRTLQLPFPVGPDQVQAQFENGVLTITIPKAQTQQRSHRIPVQGRSGQESQQTASGGQDGDDRSAKSGESGSAPQKH